LSPVGKTKPSYFDMILDTLLEETALVSAEVGRPFKSRALRVQIFGQDEKRVEVLESKRKTALESKIRKRLLILMTCSVEFPAFFFVFGDFRARQDLGDACAIPAKRFKGVGEDHHIIGPSSNTPYL
jgi:hypothetical protein